MSHGNAGPGAGLVNWLFRSRIDGTITIAQSPNLPLWLFGGFTLAAWLWRETEPAGFWFAVAADLALAWWAADEVLRGVNPWRRFLGGVTLIGLAAMIALRHTV